MKHSRLVLCGVTTAFLLSACATDDFGNRRPLSDTQKGAAIGAVGGAVVGALAGDEKGALIGAIGGGIAGGLVGNYMDKQKQDLEKVLAAERDAGVIEIDPLGENNLRITMTNQTAFDVGSAEIKPGFTSSMDKLAGVLNRYGKTTLAITGHTDNTGSEASNQDLSERRAQAVHDYFINTSVHPARLSTTGRGESEPRASNDTTDGRQSNRRVEIIVEPVVADA